MRGSILLRLAKAAGRQSLGLWCRKHFLGRYLAVELLARPLMPRGPVYKRVSGGLICECDLRDPIQRQIYYGLYDPEETRFLLSLLKPGDVFVDVGANVGYYSLLAADTVGPSGAVHAFEPIPQNLATLKANVSRNGLSNVVANQVAVTDGTSENITLYLRDGVSNSGWASIAKSTKYKNIPFHVHTTTIDHYLKIHGVSRVSLMKLDIEGAEPQALRGATELLCQEDAPDIICEINPFLLHQAGSSSRVVKQIIADHGYRLYKITSAGLVRLNAETEETSMCNIFASKGRAHGRIPTRHGAMPAGSELRIS